MRRSKICSDHMPHKTESHLPHFRKSNVFEPFLREYKVLHKDDPLTISYMLWGWKKFCPFIKVRKAGRFSRCAICGELSAAIRHALDSCRRATDLCDRKAAHIVMDMIERLNDYTIRWSNIRQNCMFTVLSYSCCWSWSVQIWLFAFRHINKSHQRKIVESSIYCRLSTS